jgi:tetratricopeptide (TPR) repeat protein
MVERSVVARSALPESSAPKCAVPAASAKLSEPAPVLLPAPAAAPDFIAPPGGILRKQCGSLAELADRKRQAASFGLPDTQEIDPIAARSSSVPPPLPGGRQTITRPVLAPQAPPTSPSSTRPPAPLLKTAAALPPRQPAATRLPVARELIAIDVHKSPQHRLLVWQFVQLTPSWLASLAVHLCLITVLNSYVIYVAVSGNYGPLTLRSEFTAGTADSGSQPELTTISLAPAAELSDEQAWTWVPRVDEPDMAPAYSEPPIELKRPATAPAPAAPGAPQGGSLPLPAGEEQGRPAITTRSYPAVDQVPAPAAALPPKPPVDEATADDIVRRFIQFDIGKLTGEEGVRAQREFQSLGTESIRSLVRGLNHAALIAGTCPVLVLSNRLSALLSQTDDPALIRYALENIGRDVSPKATHYSRIVALRDQLAARQMQLQVRAELREQGIAPNEAILERMARLFSAPAANLRVALADPDAAIRLVAAQQIERRLAELKPDEKQSLAAALIRLLRDKRLDTAAAAHSALCALADGEDYGPRPDDTPLAVTQALRAWNKRWSVDRTPSEERAAKTLLTRAKSLEKQGRKAAAIRCYQQVRELYPTTLAAKVAERRLKTLGEQAKSDDRANDKG